MSEEEKLIELYESGATMKEIRSETGLSTAEIYYILGKKGLPLRRISKATKEPFVSRVTGPRKADRMLMPIPQEIREKVEIAYRDAFKWSITEEGNFLLTPLKQESD